MIAIGSVIINELLTGFAAFSIMLFIALIFINKRSARLYPIEDSATLIAKYGGILLLLFFIIATLQTLTGDVDTERRSRLINQIFGENWTYFWFYPVALLFSTQLLWFKNTRRRPWLRILQAIVLIVVLNFENFVILTTSFHRDHSFGSGNLVGLFIQGILWDFILFIAALFILHFIRSKFIRQ